MKPISYNPPVRPLLRKNILATAVLLGMSAFSPAVNSAYRLPIGDLEIYKSLLPGRPNLMIMIDVSASMQASSVVADYNIPCSGRSYQIIDGTQDRVHVKVGGEEVVTFKPYGCQRPRSTSGSQIGIGNDKELDRLSRVQITLMSLFADEVYIGNGGQVSASTARLLPNEYAMGIGIFGYEPTGEKAKILLPVGQLDSVQRKKLITTISNLRSATQDTSTNTTQMGVSISSALTEAGAYMMGTTPYSAAYQNYTGFLESAEGDVRTSSNYNPLPATECSGKGIFLLTDDGLKKAPTPPANPAITSLSITKGKMNLSLLKGNTEPSLTVNTCSALGGNDTAWSCMGEYAQMLRSPSNPIREPIKTATAGIGQAFNIFSSTTQDITVDGKSVTVADCSAGSSTDTDTDAQNLCKLGELKEDATTAYGNGKFYPIALASLSTINAGRPANAPLLTESQYYAAQIKNSIADFASGLAGISGANPAGTITVPDNPYQVSEQLPYAYLPMLQPNISSNTSIWKGNLKKYQLNNGTLYGRSEDGRSDSALYTDTAGNLSTSTKDLWQDATEIASDSSAIDVGGVYAQLTTPASGDGSVRTVYVEDITSTEDSTPILRKLGVDTNGKLTGFNELVDPVYTEENKRRILSFLGFEQYTTATANTVSDAPQGGSASKPLLDINGNIPSDDDTTLGTSTVMIRPTEAIKVLGGVVHSKPAAISYSATLDAIGNIISPREDYALFGSMDGALHLVNAAHDSGDDSGDEQFAIIPKRMIAEQSIALVDDSTKSAVGQPYFGVDAPWLVTTDYTYDIPTDKTKTGKVKVDESTGNGMFAYGGLRMGGEAFYGMDITDKSSPKMLFTITKDGLRSTTDSKSTTTGFERLGQIWSKPTAAKIRLSTDTAADPIDVLVFGGGYDMAYEDDEYVATTDEPAKGNAIYMINAKTGALIWSTSNEVSGGKNVNTSNMIHSITGGITVLDRDNDGLMDHLYAADLGGQVFRADFENARPEKFGFSEVAAFSNKHVIRILNTTPSAVADSKYAYRFYERPVVSFYRSEGGPNNGKIFALVNVISGNRSAPLSKLRTDNAFANRVYGIIDTDVTHMDLYSTDFTLTVENVIENDTIDKVGLVNLATTLDATATLTKANNIAAKAAMIDGSKQGWYYPLTRFDGYNGVKYNKGIGDSVVINNVLYTTVYNPDKMYSTPQSCVASILGGSERQLYCLPYGVCMDEKSISGTGGYVPAGQGIQELTLGAFNSSNTNIKVLIGTRTITDRILENNRIAYDAGNTAGKYYDNATGGLKDFSELGTEVGGDGSAVEYLFRERYTLQPKTWYEKE